MGSNDAEVVMVGSTKRKIVTILNISKVIASHQTNIERTITDQVTIVNNSHSQVLKLIKQRKTEILKEATHLTNISCAKCSERVKPKDKAMCCEDCSKPQFKVPSVAECSAAGCDGTCAFGNSTCDAGGKAQPACMFPFTYLGVEHNECINHSPFGLTKRPWCYVKSRGNLAKPDMPTEWAFCDCTSVQCPKYESNN